MRIEITVWRHAIGDGQWHGLPGRAATDGGMWASPPEGDADGHWVSAVTGVENGAVHGVTMLFASRADLEREMLGAIVTSFGK
jgi:hypothetical protein